MNLRAPCPAACNDNWTTINANRITMVGFAISLVIGIVGATLVACGVIA